MRTKVFKSNIAFGVLVALVLALGVQGTADALTLTQTSQKVQSKRAGSTFEMSFRVGLTSPKTAKNTLGKQVSTINTGAIRIDSSGYAVTDIGSSVYRNPPSGDTVADLRPTTGPGRAVVTLDNSKRPTYADDANQATEYTGAYLVTTGRLAVTATDGHPIYIRTGTGTREDPDTTEKEYDPFKYVRAQGDADGPIPEANRWDFNDEAIGITFPDEADTGAGTVKLKNPSFIFGNIDTPTDLGAGYTGETSLQERVRVGLPTSITLVCEGAAVGTHDIVIWDATNDDDFPVNGVPDPSQPRQSITFTLHVTPATTTIVDADGIEPDIQRIAVEDAVEPVYVDPGEHLTFTGTNNRIRYEVVRGSGTLYVGTLEQQHTTPSTVISVHQASHVFLNTNNGSNEVHVWFAGEDRSAPRATIIFEYRGQPVPTTRIPTIPTPTPAPTTRGSLNISVSPSTGTTRTVTVTALNAGGTAVPGISVLLNVNNGATLSRSSGGTPLTSTLTLPATAGDYTLSATTTADYTGDSETITVTLPGSLTLALIGSQVNGSQNVQVTARNAAGSLETTAVTVTLSGAGISRTVSVTGSQNVPIPLPTTSGTLTASATGYNSGSVILPARSTTPTTPTPTPTPTPTGTAGVANSIEIEGSRTLEGTVDTSTRLRARVLDANDRGVSDVRVTFRILAPGRGRLSQRGNGRAVQVNTDRNGYATASLTPLGGNLIVEAKAAGVSAPVTFIIDVGEETEVEDTTGAARAYKVGEKIPISLQDTLTFRGSRTVNGTTYTCVGSGECVVSYGTLVKGEIRVATKTTTSDTATPSREINPVVQVAAANRPPMLWVDGGGIYALVGASVQRFAPSVDNALNLIVAGGKVYWTEQTGESAGTINSANLNGSGVTELASIQAVPMGIAVDVPNSKLYWTNSRGRIQSANLNGSRITNELQNLPGPKDIAVARGNVYWTQYDPTAGAGSVGIANSTGRGSPKYMSTGSDTPGSLVISGNKVYWTEMTGTSSGTINSANLNGNDAKELNAIRAVPMGIAVDGSRSKLYWTNSRGRIQSADLDGSKVENVVDGLGGPGDMVLSNSIQAPTGTTPIPPDTTVGKSKYDINGDGSVDTTDVDLLLLAILAELTTAKYDVNTDGKVDIADVRAVNANLDAGAAGAPTLLGKQFSALEVSRLQEQIELLIATGDRSPAAMKTLIYLQQLIAMARPEQTQLFANYPNPFNPETWMPYELATDTNVKITIYNPQGVVIRTLQLGQQSAGYYTDRERAAYWDGKNALGEQVASGIYFYQLETDAMSSLRKMVILK